MSTSTPTPTGTPDTSPNSGNGQPLLFFVALGFGVVFTNLWIIVGVKYCFRYNQRHRQLRNEDTGEPIDLMAVPRTHRRRREKKLMSMDEVNSRFPLTKYKAWRASRADEGLPTAGGIEAPSGSRPATLRRSSGTVTDITNNPTIVTYAEASNTFHEEHKLLPKSDASEKETVPSPSEARASGEQPKLQAPDVNQDHLNDDDDDDHDDPIHAAMPAELLANPGDSCAICLDIIEDDDDVRGLTCGHAFHASCVDPWLTSRRACCPLCKADYYVPKPRPDGSDGNNEPERGRRNTDRGNNPAEPEPVFVGSRLHPFSTRIVLPGRFISIGPSDDRHGYSRGAREPRPSQSSPARGNDPDTTANRNDPSTVWRPRLPSLFLPRISLPSFRRSRPPQDQSRRNTEPTPGQLESGTR
ncbi:hypothetical protein PRK78_003995 [Emydomyces testavorans]|uniref:RING-type domain-containing protein n=1 Tax=Emydomyces testavorans TaxID=2070801 RepID=A0AAF0IJ34_9EURO|nr:hypothetical protein PRK78_003995 [Emydomyces testavorans]